MMGKKVSAGLVVAVLMTIEHICCAAYLHKTDTPTLPYTAQSRHTRRWTGEEGRSAQPNSWRYSPDYLTKNSRRLQRAGLAPDIIQLSLGARGMAPLHKRRPEMGSTGFFADTFDGGMGHFDTMKKRRPEMDSSGFYGDTFRSGMGYFDTMKKRRPEMDSSGFYGDTFDAGMGYFDTMKKRRPEMDASGFYADTFDGGLNFFDTMKRRQGMNPSSYTENTLNDNMDYPDTKSKSPIKRRHVTGSDGFHGDTFSSGFGYFDTMKKRQRGPGAPEEPASGRSTSEDTDPLFPAPAAPPVSSAARQHTAAPEQSQGQAGRGTRSYLAGQFPDRR